MGFPGCISATLQPGSPVVGPRGKYPVSYPKALPGAVPTIRYVRRGDPVTTGLANMGPGLNVERDPVPNSAFVHRLEEVVKTRKNAFLAWSANAIKWVTEGFERVKQHSLRTYIPWERFQDIL